MKTTPVTHEDLARSVIAVPPLCRTSSGSLSKAQNAKLVRHLYQGGIRTLLYGGNANLYHIALSEYDQLLRMLADIMPADDMWVVPAVGPMFGTMMDQAEILREHTYPTAMVLPTLFPAKPSGVATAVRKFVDRAEIPAVLYIKEEGYITPELAAELVNDGVISWIKYAIVREHPKKDPFLKKLMSKVDPAMVVSGIGEQPAITHLRDFKCGGFTAGCVCVAPQFSTDLLHAIQAGEWQEAESIRAVFEPLENLRNAHSPILVLHHAVELAEIARTGPIQPLLDSLPEKLLTRIEKSSKALLKKHAVRLKSAR
jgi:dihydrodipicolinate synthase/N-acetylneuraminate lyase